MCGELAAFFHQPSSPTDNLADFDFLFEGKDAGVTSRKTLGYHDRLRIFNVLQRKRSADEDPSR